MENPNQWQETADGLKAVLKFPSFTDLTKFLAELGPEADKRDHHPDIEIKKAVELYITLFTHSEKKVTEKDHELASKIDGLFENYG